MMVLIRSGHASLALQDEFWSISGIISQLNMMLVGRAMERDICGRSLRALTSDNAT